MATKKKQVPLNQGAVPVASSVMGKAKPVPPPQKGGK